MEREGCLPAFNVSPTWQLGLGRLTSRIWQNLQFIVCIISSRNTILASQCRCYVIQHEAVCLQCEPLGLLAGGG